MLTPKVRQRCASKVRGLRHSLAFRRRQRTAGRERTLDALIALAILSADALREPGPIGML